MPTPERLLLDTPVLLWWKADRRRLSAAARSNIDQAEQILISPLTFWEIATAARQTAHRTRPPHHDLGPRRPGRPPNRTGNRLPRDRSDRRRTPRIPRRPIDRVLTATALHNQCPVLPKDRRIRDYARRSTLTALW
jgi:PIN domain nuclease of toxin-antitoxin system